MIDSFFIAWKYLRFHQAKTTILVSVIALTLYLPAGLDALIDESATQLRKRALETPLLVGARGSETELVLNSLYFESEPPPETTVSALERVNASGYAKAIPLHTRFQTKGNPIVGTNLDYFQFRRLRIGQGRQFAMLGECVVGATVAREFKLSPGDSLLSQPENFFDLAGVYPLKMNVVGVLEHSSSPDDDAVFVDVKTAWVIAGLGHGHQDLTKEESNDALLEKDGNRLTANASVLTYTEITPENATSFHFHGDRSSFPLTSVIALPQDMRSRTLLMGRFQSPSETLQIVEPSNVMDELLATILRVRTFILVGTILLGIATMLSVVLVFALSLRLRKNELATMRKIGATRSRIFHIVTWEILLVTLFSGVIAVSLTATTRQFSDRAIQWFLL